MANLEKEMERIEKNLKSQESFLLWNAFTRYPLEERFMDDDTLIRFCQDAYKLLEGHDDLYVIDDEHPFEENIDWIMMKYKELLLKYDCSADNTEKAVEKMLFCYYAGWTNIFQAIAEHYGYNGDDADIDDEDELNSQIAYEIILLKTSDDGKRLLAEYGIRDEVLQLKTIYWFASQILVDFVVRPVPNESGMKAYQDIVDLNMLIWIAVAMGEDFSVIRETVLKANKENNIMCKCNLFREAIPFERFLELIEIKVEEFEAVHPEAFEDDQYEE